MLDQSQTPYPIEEALARLLLEELPAIVWSTDCDLRLTSALGTGLSALNLRHEQVVGMTLLRFFRTADRSSPVIVAHSRALLGELMSFEQEWAGYTYQARVNPLRDEAGRIIGCIGVAQDSTERNRIERALLKAQGDLERRVTERTVELAESTRHWRHEIRERKQVEEALRKEHQYLQHLLELQNRDRQLISYELHDGLVQQLAGAMMQFQTLESRVTGEKWRELEAGLHMLKECMREARWLIQGLRPPILDEYGVVAAIEDLISQIAGANEPAIEFSHRLSFDRLPSSLENTIFRIVQESLNNARRHSRSKRVQIRLVQRGEQLRIAVRDWGVGFSPTKVVAGRFGLAGIKERARLFGGGAIIRSSRRKGTRIVVELPLSPSPPRRAVPRVDHCESLSR